MFFRMQPNLEALKNEQKLFVMYSAVEKYASPGYSGFVNDDDSRETIREHLDRQLFISNELFLTEVERFLGKMISLLDINRFKKHFNEVILLQDESEDLLERLDEFSLHNFLYALCFVGAENALRIFVVKFPQAVNGLSTKEFNSICLAAARNHLYDFMSFLCKQGKSIDEYSIVDISYGCSMLTPFVGACLRVSFEVSGFTPQRVEKAKQMVALLLAHGADPNKKYTYDDFTEEAITEYIAKGKGYSIPDIYQENLDNVTKELTDKLRNSLGCENNVRHFFAFVGHVALLKPGNAVGNKMK